MKFVLWVLWQIAAVPAVGCSTIVVALVVPLLAFALLVFVYQQMSL